MKKIYPQKLKAGDGVRIIAPSCSMGVVSNEVREIANKRFAGMGLELSFGKHIEEMDDFRSSSIQSRLEDIHDAFADKNVKAVFAVNGGFNSNQLLRYLNWDLIRSHPKIFCGYSDITALSNAVFAKTGLVTYSGPVYSDFGQKLHFDYTMEYFKRCLMSYDPVEIQPSKVWSDDAWYKNQQERNLIDNDGLLVINEGRASGTILGGNLCTFNLLQGTEYFPDLEGSVLFLEEDYASFPRMFDRDLQSLIHLSSFGGVKGIVIGRFQKASGITNGLLVQIIKTKRELDGLPVIANVDFGHTDPRITFPIGGESEIETRNVLSVIGILKH